MPYHYRHAGWVPRWHRAPVPSPPQRPFASSFGNRWQPFECCEDRLGSDLSPSATPTAQTSLTHCSKRAHRPASARTTPSEPSDAVVASANGARKQSLLQSGGGLIVLHFAAHPGVTQFFAQGLRSLRVARFGASCTSANSERCLTRPGLAQLRHLSSPVRPARHRTDRAAA